MSISSPQGENHLPKTVTIGESLSSARNEPLGKLACCCLFSLGCLFVSQSALVDLAFKSDLVGSLRLFFATVELKLFSTIFRSRPVDLFFVSGVAVGSTFDALHLEAVASRDSKFFNLGGSVAFESHLCMLSVAKWWQFTTCGGWLAEHRFRVSFGY